MQKRKPASRKKSRSHSRSAPVRLLETALDAFAKSGFEGASLRGIAEEAGFSFQLITYHFGSKEDLWIAAVKYLFDQRTHAIQAAAADPQGDLLRNPREWMRRWLRTGVLFAIEDPRLRQLVVQEFFANSERYRKIIRPKLKEMATDLEASFSHMCASGALSRFSAQEALLLYRSILAANILMPYEVELMAGLSISTPAFIEKQVDLLVAVLMDGHGVDAPDMRPRQRHRKAAKRTARPK